MTYIAESLNFFRKAWLFRCDCDTCELQPKNTERSHNRYCDSSAATANDSFYIKQIPCWRRAVGKTHIHCQALRLHSHFHKSAACSSRHQVLTALPLLNYSSCHSSRVIPTAFTGSSSATLCHPLADDAAAAAAAAAAAHRQTEVPVAPCPRSGHAPREQRRCAQASHCEMPQASIPSPSPQ